MKFALITNIPAPYRLPIFESLGKKFGNDFLVIYAADREQNRSWDLPEIGFNHRFLKKNVTAKKDGFNFIHNNTDVWTHLVNFAPDVVITTGFNPTHLYAYCYAKLHKKKHIPMTDGWIESEKSLSLVHKLLRTIIFKTSHAFIGASKNSIALYSSYGINKKNIFQSHLCADNSRFDNNNGFNDREYDLMYSGQFTERKLPFFFTEIAEKVARKKSKMKVLILGDGPLREAFFEKLNKANIDFHYAGFVSQAQLPSFYSNSKIFLFTTRLDPWGVVVNEAMASGTPVFTTPFAGVINDLVIDKDNGYILPIDSSVWCDYAINLLNDQTRWEKLSDSAKKSVQEFSFENAAHGIEDACCFASNLG